MYLPTSTHNFPSNSSGRPDVSVCRDSGIVEGLEVAIVCCTPFVSTYIQIYTSIGATMRHEDTGDAVVTDNKITISVTM